MDDQQTITAIEPQRRRGRVNVFLDGEFALGVHEDVVAALHLGVGQRISEERLRHLAREETLARARDRAYLLLSYRARSEKEVRDRLTRAGYEEDIVQEVLEKLNSLGFVNDEDFARSYVHGRQVSRPSGKRALEWELRRKGVAPEMVEKATEAVDDASERAAAEAAARSRIARWAGLPRVEARRKAAAFLQRRGFAWDTIISVMDSILPPDVGEEGSMFDA